MMINCIIKRWIAQTLLVPSWIHHLLRVSQILFDHKPLDDNADGVSKTIVQPFSGVQ